MVKIPEALAQRPQYKGFPVPFVVLWADGVPDFKELDPERTRQALTERLCGLCGTKMGNKVCFVGGQLSLLNKIYTDPPNHEDCAVYAAQVCPHLAAGKDYAANTKREAEMLGLVPIGQGGPVFLLIAKSYTAFGPFITPLGVTNTRCFVQGVETEWPTQTK